MFLTADYGLKVEPGILIQQVISPHSQLAVCSVCVKSNPVFIYRPVSVNWKQTRWLHTSMSWAKGGSRSERDSKSGKY